jgi:mitochondrial import inner membrane translocase subunit TIM22
MSYDTPFAGPGASAQAATLTSMPLRKQLAIGFKDMGSRAWSTGKNFGMIGCLYTGIECGIEGFRAKNDLPGAIAAGCITGGIIARKTGPIGVLAGMAGFGAFSAAIEVYMRQPADE